MRGRIMNGGPEGEWRDVLGIEAIRSTLPPQPYDPKHPLEAEESKELVDLFSPPSIHVISAETAFIL